MAKLVNWYNFERKIREKRLPIFSSLDIQRLFGVTKIAATFLAHRYAKKGFIVRIKRGLYTLSRPLPPELFVANKIYEPSYVSLEFALSYHRVIPETVYEITSVTPKATRRFETMGKIFSYHKIKKAAFTGYGIERQGGIGFRIADAEKAFVDTNYFRFLAHRPPITRFDKEKIDARKAERYAKLFGNNKFLSIIKTTLQ
ncbi:MAG: hypothetical protein AAB731_02510 [Patescibacteria group bacterium]